MIDISIGRLNRNYVLKAMIKLQKSICPFEMLSEEYRKRIGFTHCDCQYGFADEELLTDREAGGETGCPEISTVIALLSKMTDEEYLAICNKKN